MKNYFLTLILLVLGASSASVAQASLLGSTVFLSHRSPDLSSVTESYPVNVENGTGDTNVFGLVYTSNPESDRILVNFFRPFDFEPTAFNGHAGEFVSEPINDISVDTNLKGWDSSRLAYTQNSFNFNWSGLTVDQDSYFYAKLSFAGNNPNQPTVPEPATILLFGMGAGSLFFPSLKRKFSQK